MNANEYQAACYRFDNHIDNPTGLVYGLCAEAGEVAGEFEKLSREQFAHESPHYPDRRHRIALELGDVCWNVARLADELGYTLEEIMQLNIEKLEARHGRAVNVD